MNRTTRRSVLAALIASALLWTALPPAPLGAEERKLSAVEIENKLIGNTVEGEWDGSAYKQFFDASGNTIYVEDGRMPAFGRWKADPEKNAFCSWWENSGEACYEVVQIGPDTILWVSPGTGKESPAKVLQGDQL